MNSIEIFSVGWLQTLAAVLCLWVATPSVVVAQNARVIKRSDSPNQRQPGVLIPGAFNVRKGETLGMYAAWTGISPRQLIIHAGIKHPSEFQEGLVLHLLLTPEQWMRVHAARSTTRPQFQGLQPLTPLQPLSPMDKLEAPAFDQIKFLVHTVQSGENATVIARYYGLELDMLRQANGDKSFAKILPGQEIYIPNFQGKAIPPQARVLPAPSKKKQISKKKRPIIVPVRKTP